MRSPAAAAIRTEICREAAEAAEAVFPRRCPVCGKPVVPRGSLICSGCAGIPRKVQAPRCSRCGRHLTRRESLPEGICISCRTLPQRFDRGAAVFEYGSVRKSIYRYKYGGRAEYAGYFGLMMSRKLREAFDPEEAQLLVPVPLDRERLADRGYNQAALLAEEIAAHTGIPCSEGALQRVRSTVPMKRMSPAERRNNLKNAFIACSNDVKSKMIMLIDDIYTTGATASACAEACFDAGAAGVSILALAIGEET